MLNKNNNRHWLLIILIELIRVLKFPVAFLTIIVTLHFFDISRFLKDLDTFMADTGIKEVKTPYIQITREQVITLKSKFEELVAVDGDNNLDKFGKSQKNLEKLKEFDNTLKNIFNSNVNNECYEREFTTDDLKHYFGVDNITGNYYSSNILNLKDDLYNLEFCNEPASYTKGLSKGSYISTIKNIKTINNTFILKFYKM